MCRLLHISVIKTLAKKNLREKGFFWLLGQGEDLSWYGSQGYGSLSQPAISSPQSGSGVMTDYCLAPFLASQSGTGSAHSEQILSPQLILSSDSSLAVHRTLPGDLGGHMSG